MMPSKYKTKADLPEPKNPNLRLREVEAHTVAAIAWRCGLVTNWAAFLYFLHRLMLATEDLLLCCEAIAIRVSMVLKVTTDFLQ